MPVFNVFESKNPDIKLGSFIGVIEANIFRGTWLDKPFEKKDYDSWVIKKDGVVVMRDCTLECVDSFNVGMQFMVGKGIPIKKS
jgi:hypothetical protein